jgi:hypothetical protein
MARLAQVVGNHRFSALVIPLGALGVAGGLLPAALSGAQELPGDQTLTFTLHAAAQFTPTPDPDCPLKQVIEGAGQTNLLGPVHDEQSDCAHPDGTIDQGVFTMTGATLGGGLPGGVDSGDSITGQYRAHLVPTIASQLTNPPSGFWLIYGEVCTWKGTGKFAGVKNDCPTAENPGRFFPARLTIDLDTTQALIFGTMVVRFKAAE